MGKREWKSCNSCKQFQPAKQEGLCKYLGEYNNAPVFVHRHFKCVKYVRKEENRGSVRTESKAH